MRRRPSTPVPSVELLFRLAFSTVASFLWTGKISLARRRVAVDWGDVFAPRGIAALQQQRKTPFGLRRITRKPSSRREALTD
jgi:hypothetical protein